MPMIGVDCFVMAVPQGRSTESAADELSMDNKVAWAEPVQLYHAQEAAASHNDPLYPAQPAAKAWDLADLHRLTTGRGIKVAVIDSGIQANHPDLAGQLIVNRNFVSGQAEVAEDHGTGVAGVIAAKSDNGIGIAGVAPGARLLGLRACWQERAATATTVCDGLSLAKAFYFAVQAKADVINLSLSGPDSRLLRALLDAALSRGSIVVTAYDSAKPGGGFPASVPGVIAVSDHSFAGDRRPGLHGAGPRRAHHRAGRTMVPGQRQLLFGSACQRSRRAGPPAAALGRRDACIGPAQRRRDRRLRDRGARGEPLRLLVRRFACRELEGRALADRRRRLRARCVGFQAPH